MSRGYNCGVLYTKGWKAGHHPVGSLFIAGERSMRVRTRFPNVFVGHPFAGRFPAKKFRKILQELPFTVVYGNTDLQTKHLLDIMRANILKADFSIFDLSDWNSNVALELGL